MSNLIRMTRAGETIPVHPNHVREHVRQGWAILSKHEPDPAPAPASAPAAQAAPEAPAPAPVADAEKAHAENNVEQLRAIAREMGLTVHHRAGADRIRAQIEEARASGT